MYIPHTEDDRRAMLEALGVASVDDLFVDVPASLKIAALDLPPGVDEMQARARMRELAERNRPAARLRCFLGGGAYQHFIPAAVSALVSRGEFCTAYTPYQPEASQGTLIAIYEFQSMVAELFGLDVANASLYDGASALAEAVIVAVRHTRRSRVVISETVHPHYRATVHSYLERQPVTLVGVPHRNGLTDLSALEAACDGDTAAVVFQHPNVFGRLEPGEALCELAHRHGGLALACGHPLAFGLLRPPGHFGADLACAEGQPLGLPLSYGGPYLGLLAARQELVRKLPGRLVGKTVDAEGKPGYVLTLQTREQHIRRDKATSNICTNQGLCALMATMYLSMLGPQGLREVAALNVANANALIKCLAASCAYADNRISLPFPGSCFNEFVLRLERDPDDVLTAMRSHGVLGGIALRRWYPELDRHLLVCSTEVHTEEDRAAYVAALENAL